MRLLIWLALLPVALAPASVANINQKTRVPYTSFQTPTEYRAENDIRTDAVIVYSDLADRIRSWREKGYAVQTMYGFRTYQDYVDKHPEEVQTAADGTMLTCGPGSYYMVPTQNRIRAATEYFTRAIAGGTSAVVPEEPEFFASAGYSGAFRKAWLEHYKEPWQDPTSSIEARWKSERLKAKMEHDMVKAILDSAERQNPAVRRMVAVHSPVNYVAWNVAFSHYRCMMIPNLQEIVGQVWTGTARSACKYAGKTEERTFENAFLEYSSLYNLARGTGKRMWFLMDPLEDHPDCTMEDYDANYERTLVASLMFPEIDAYEVLPWPTRIYGRVPESFATKISNIVAALQDMHSQGSVRYDMGTRGIATFVADSMIWQRGAPKKSNFDSFYGLTLPLIYRGIPVDVAQFERAPEKGYLDRYKVLLLSYDIMKPARPEYSQAIADWVRRGGVLVFFGGTDAYNALPEWWRKRGFESPQADLYSRLAVRGNLTSLSGADSGYRELIRADGRYRAGENRTVYTLDLGPFAKNGVVYVRFRDAYTDDGYGPALTLVKLTVNGKIVSEFVAGSEREKTHLVDPGGSQFNGLHRFADGDAYWIYRFAVPKGCAPVLQVDLMNQFIVEAASRLDTTDRLVYLNGRAWKVPRRFALTLSSARTGNRAAARRQDGAVFEHAFGRGRLLHIGVQPAYFASSLEGANMLISAVASACERAGLDYREQQHMAIRRGHYVAVRTFEGRKRLAGRYVDILDPRLSVVENPVVGPWRCALYLDATSRFVGAPKLLYTSCRIEARSETRDAVRLTLSGPLKTKGVARIYTGGRSLASVYPADTRVDPEHDSVLLTFDNNPDGTLLVANWK